MTSHPDFADITEPQLVETARRRRTFSIGLPRCDSKTEKRFPLTPEGVNMLVERGFTVKMESEAATSIHYP
ncbi:MAG: alanine dehydrogenase, partial [Muribaculaceae bacterium]|nr:alanine dehydrogenase [Muribaculaceae bacterium]